LDIEDDKMDEQKEEVDKKGIQEAEMKEGWD
jgi:hypothetical protein